ncbi:MAG: hypothetical protein ACWA5U_03715 [bacterium]
MALDPRDAQHALQITAGITGRKRGHEFEVELANIVNAEPFSGSVPNEHVFRGAPHTALVNKALLLVGWNKCDSVKAIALGSLATAEEGKRWMKVHGIEVKACKSDILLTLYQGNNYQTVGISVKQCNNKKPTNAQLYFTTATAFCRLLQNSNIPVSDAAITALRQFCGDDGFRPLDQSSTIGRSTDPRRYFWEEIDNSGRLELETLLATKQDEITRLLLQKAYLNDPFVPELLIHKTRKIEHGDQEYALYTIDELISLSRKYGGFNKKTYSVRKGQYKDPPEIKHEAPRFGIVQMQRGGQKQHPTQLQFNLQAGYFYKI